jgi:tetratricopeptide (TPR) repeat protein
MRIALLLLTLSAFAQDAALDQPKNIRVSTWVREDLFAGFIDNQMVPFERGVKKLDRILAANPKAADAIAWMGGAEMYRAIRAHEAGDAAVFRTHFAKAREHFARCAEILKEIPQYGIACHAITGGSYSTMSDRLPAAERKAGWQAAREHYTALVGIHGAEFDQIPVHFRGEILAGLTMAAQRLGEKDKAAAMTRELIEKLPGTPYAVFARRWLDKPESMAKTKLNCATCHDAGRLAAVQARLKTN